jgi:hypothetical protein
MLAVFAHPPSEEQAMPVQIASRRASQATLMARFPGAALIDVTSRGDEPWVRFSPFYPHGDIPGSTLAGPDRRERGGDLAGAQGVRARGR